MCVCMSVYICMCVCMYVRVCVYVCMYGHARVQSVVCHCVELYLMTF